MKVKLGDIATYINGYAFKPSDWKTQGIPIIRIQDLTGNSYQTNYYDGESIDKKYEVNEGDVLISWSASLGVYIWKGEKALLNQHIFKVVFDKIDIDKMYYIYALKFSLMKMKSFMHGATMKHIVKKDFDNITIPFPSLEEQSKIAGILQLVEGIIEKRKKQLEDLDELVKARFVEIFGDPVKDDDKYSKILMGNVLNIGSSKRIFEREYVKEGIPFYRTKEIVELSKGNNITTELFITKERYEELKKDYGVPKEGDLLISAVGTIGTIWVVNNKNKFYYKDGNLLCIRNSNQFNSIYLKVLLEKLIKNYKLKMASGTAYSALTISALKKMEIYDVPISEQNQFADFVKQTEEIKEKVQKSLDETQVLFDKLMQDYF